MSQTTDETDPVIDEVNEYNAFEPDLAIDVHSNSGRDDKFEAFYHYKGSLSKDLAENIETEVKKIGLLLSRGSNCLFNLLNKISKK